MPSLLRRSCITILLFAFLACAKQEEIVFPEHPPRPMFVDPSAAIERLAGKIAAMEQQGAVDCGEIGQRLPRHVASCATAALGERRPFFSVIRQSSGFLDRTTRPSRPVVTSVISGDESGNVEMVSIEPLMIGLGAGCGIGALPPVPRIATPPRVHVSVRPLVIAGKPTQAARTNLLTTTAVIDRILEPAPSKAPYDLPRERFFVSIELDDWGHVVSCDAARSLPPSLREPVCDAAMQWRYKPASFLGQRVSSTREITFEVDGRAIRTLHP